MARAFWTAAVLLLSTAAVAQSAPLPGPPLAVLQREGDSLPAQTSWPGAARIGHDELIHATGSLLLTLSGQYVLTDKLDLSRERALPVAAGTALALGVLKELADSRRPVAPQFSWRDLAADAVGVALGALVAAW